MAKQDKKQSDIMILKKFFGLRQVMDDDGTYREQGLKEFMAEVGELSNTDKTDLAKQAREIIESDAADKAA